MGELEAEEGVRLVCSLGVQRSSEAEDVRRSPLVQRRCERTTLLALAIWVGPRLRVAQGAEVVQGTALLRSRIVSELFRHRSVDVWSFAADRDGLVALRKWLMT